MRIKRLFKYNNIILLVTLIIFIILMLFLCNYFSSPIVQIKNIEINDNGILQIDIITDNKLRKHNNLYYTLVDINDEKLPSSTSKYNIITNNQISIDLTQNKKYKVYIINEHSDIIKVTGIENIGKILSIVPNKDKIYLSIGSTYKPNIEIKGIGNYDTTITYTSSDDKIAKVNDDGTIQALEKGQALINIKAGEMSSSIKVISTDLIVNAPKSFNSKKSYLPCNKYSKEENDLLDEILADRINDKGYQTRAGVVEAARFLTLEFPYKIRYFSENGRLSTNKVEGEGRYYHKGLYLHKSRFENISKSRYGPETWGCSLYSGPSHGKRSNGLDCSGFVSWVLLNGGFDVGDIGAGLASHLDLTDYGKRTKFNLNVVNSGKVKVGDLLSSGGVNGGHIAIIVGEDNDYYYVAESLWTPPNVAVVIMQYSKKTIFNRYYYVMLMDDYYKNDGNLTKLWY